MGDREAGCLQRATEMNCQFNIVTIDDELRLPKRRLSLERRVVAEAVRFFQ
jgi:hypothetical protein